MLLFVVLWLFKNNFDKIISEKVKIHIFSPPWSLLSLTPVINAPDQKARMRK